jgi:hypothetical protein
LERIQNAWEIVVWLQWASEQLTTSVFEWSSFWPLLNLRRESKHRQKFNVVQKLIYARQKYWLSDNGSLRKPNYVILKSACSVFRCPVLGCSLFSIQPMCVWRLKC